MSSQNHDQIGNRAAGDRLTDALDDDQLGCAALVTMCSPFTPMLFQGEEWAASTPFQFFTSHTDPEIGAATSEGRLEEFAQHGWDDDGAGPAGHGDVPAFQAGLVRARSSRVVERMLSAYRRLAELRRTHADLTAPSFAECAADEESRVFTMRRGALTVLVNFGAQRADGGRRPPENSSSRPSPVSISRTAASRCRHTPAACWPTRRRAD